MSTFRAVIGLLQPKVAKFQDTLLSRGYCWQSRHLLKNSSFSLSTSRVLYSESKNMENLCGYSTKHNRVSKQMIVTSVHTCKIDFAVLVRISFFVNDLDTSISLLSKGSPFGNPGFFDLGLDCCLKGLLQSHNLFILVIGWGGDLQPNLEQV